jgi:hypothetical protein
MGKHLCPGPRPQIFRQLTGVGDKIPVKGTLRSAQ